MSIIVNEYTRTLNDLEAAAVEMAIAKRWNSNHPLTIVLGRRDGHPFITLGRSEDVTIDITQEIGEEKPEKKAKRA